VASAGKSRVDEAMPHPGGDDAAASRGEEPEAVPRGELSWFEELRGDDVDPAVVRRGVDAAGWSPKEPEPARRASGRRYD
jgi:hypothetical protein